MEARMDFNLSGHDYAVRKITRLGIFGGLAIAMSVLESLVPQPLPWSRIGFANIVILVVLYLEGPLAAIAVGALKVFGGSLVMGAGFSPAFWLALSGTVVSLIVMIPLPRFPRIFSPVGVAVAGSAAFNIAQLVAAGLLLVGIKSLLQLLPYMLIASIITGGIIGWLAGWLLSRLSRNGIGTPQRWNYANIRI
jgi:heptaprenyl diphosphate synthase